MPESRQDAKLKGQNVDSMPEWYFGTALDKLGYDYKYHWSIGLAGTAGSIEVDFVVYAPMQIPIEVQGDRWHPDATAENATIRTAAIVQYFKREPIIVDAKEIFSIASAMVKIRSILA